MAAVICPPLGWEAIQSYDALRSLGDRLAASGVHTLRLHYDGTGESAGTDRDADRWDAWVDSIEQARATLAAQPGVTDVVLVGLRMGATLAAALSERIGVAGLVLWEACPSGSFYLRELEILASASPDGPDTQGVEPGDLVATGHLYTAETQERLRQIDLTGSIPKDSPDVLLVARDDRPPPTRIGEHFRAAGCAVDVAHLPGHKEMMIYPERSSPPGVILEKIVDWVAARGTESPAEPWYWVPAASATHGDVLRSPVRTGPGGRFGMLMEPAVRRPGPTAGLLLLTGGVVPRTAVNRMYVEVGRRLAGAGWKVLRIDLASIGESVPVGSVARSDAYPPEMHADVRAARDALVTATDGGPITLMGLCSGAYAAFRSAVTDGGVARIVLLNPLLLGAWDDPVYGEEVLTAEETRGAVVDGSRWKRLLSGQVDVAAKAREAFDQLRHRASGLADRVGSMGGRIPDGVPSEMAVLLESGVDVQVVYSEGDRGLAVFDRTLAGSEDHLVGLGLGFTLISEADHTFNALSARNELLSFLEKHLASAEGGTGPDPE